MYLITYSHVRLLAPRVTVTWSSYFCLVRRAAGNYKSSARCRVVKIIENASAVAGMAFDGRLVGLAQALQVLIPQPYLPIPMTEYQRFVAYSMSIFLMLAVYIFEISPLGM